jgi:hypothetical protein
MEAAVLGKAIEYGSGLSGRGVVNNSTVGVSKKISGQMGERGWTSDLLDSTRNKPFTTRDALNKSNGNKATAYFNKDGSHMVIDNGTNNIIQISNRNDPNWRPDATIVNPYKSK